MRDISLKDATVTLLLEIEGEVHLVAMDKDRLDAVTLLVKQAARAAVPTGKSQKELRTFLGV